MSFMTQKRIKREKIKNGTIYGISNIRRVQKKKKI